MDKLYNKSFKDLSGRRFLWATNRFRMESENIKNKRNGIKGNQHWNTFLLITKFLSTILKFIGLYNRGNRNALDIHYNQISLGFKNLPKNFDNFKILHLTDLHIDGMPELTNRLCNKIRGKSFNICVMTGDFRSGIHGSNKDVFQYIKKLIENIETKQGIYAILGNHDDCMMVPAFEKMGIRVLINETACLAEGDDLIQLTGIDDIHYYYTDMVLETYDSIDPRKFTINLVHSPEIYDYAADSGVDLYLCGHTHGGQICLPGGYAVLRHLYRGRKFYKGVWKYKNMVGLTNCGAGTSAIPVRFNVRGEIVELTLRRAPSR